MTVPLIAKANLVIGEQYTLTIGIADVGDGIYDSGLFIEANAVTTAGLVNAKSENGIKVYPNPNNGEFTIDFNGHEAELFELYDVTGKLIDSSVLNSSQTTLQLQINQGLGVYYFLLHTPHGIVNHKIVVQ